MAINYLKSQDEQGNRYLQKGRERRDAGRGRDEKRNATIIDMCCIYAITSHNECNQVLKIHPN